MDRSLASKESTNLAVATNVSSIGVDLSASRTSRPWKEHSMSCREINEEGGAQGSGLHVQLSKMS